MTVALDAFPAYYDADGNPLSGGLLYTYEAGTTNPLETYTDRDGATPNPNPVVLDSAGRASVWLTLNVPYKLVLQSASGVTISTVDDYYGGADPNQLQAAGIVPATGGTYTGPVEFKGGTTFSGTPAQDLAALDSLGISSSQTANLWINSDLSVAQRLFFSSTMNDGTYGFDRTIALCDGGALIHAVLPNPEIGTVSAGRFTQPDASPKRIGLCQIIEGRNAIATQNGNLSFTARIRASSATTVRMALVSWTGAVDATPRDVVNNWSSTNYSAGNFFIANTLTIGQAAQVLGENTWTDVTVSSTSPGGTVVSTGTTNIYMVIWTEVAVAQAFKLDVARIRCGVGALPQMWVPPDPSVEYMRCRRYMHMVTGQPVYAQGQAVNSSAASIFFQFPVAMRTSPSVSANAITLTNAGGGSLGSSSISVSLGGNQTSLALVQGATGLVAGNATILAGSNGGSFVAWDAEL